MPTTAAPLPPVASPPRDIAADLARLAGASAAPPLAAVPQSGSGLSLTDAFEAPSRAVETFKHDGRAVLLFNGECSVCKNISNWVIRSDEPSNGGFQAINERPIGHDPDVLKQIHPGLNIWDVYEAIHVIMPDGTIKRGGEAIAEVLRRLPATRRLAWLLDVGIGGARPFQALLNAAYYVLDRLRPALGCKACGRPVPWWGKPIEWTVKAWQAIARR